MQGAFSHNGFAKDYKPGKNGFFRKVVSPGRVKGPILITHTDNDTAVGVNYAIISRLSGTEAPASGMPRTCSVASVATAPFTPRRPSSGRSARPASRTTSIAGACYNLLADDFISDHGDVHTPEVANALAQSIASTR